MRLSIMVYRRKSFGDCGDVMDSGYALAHGHFHLLVSFLARVDQVRYRGRVCPEMERSGLLLSFLVCQRHALMLPEMLRPGFNEKSFQEVSRTRQVLKEAPLECPVTQTFKMDVVHGSDKLGLSLRGHVIRYRYQDRSVVQFRFSHHNRFGPMHRRREVCSFSAGQSKASRQPDAGQEHA